MAVAQSRWWGPSVTRASDVRAACGAEYPANQHDCNAFVKAVGEHFGLVFTGQADDIVDQIHGPEWTRLGSGVEAAAAAAADLFVVAGLRSRDHDPPRHHGHVAVVVAGPLAHGRYPTGYWGSLGGSPGAEKTLNFSWNTRDRDSVVYAARPI